MPISILKLAETLDCQTTVLLFGSGSSIPSGAPSVTALLKRLEQTFKVPMGNFTLAEYTGLLEIKFSRRQLIETVREAFKNVRPTGGLLNLPAYPWRSIFTTNYDTLIENCYARLGKELTVYSSNFDFTIHNRPAATPLFKLHGDLAKDVSDGNNSRIIITESDYDKTGDYREYLYDRLKGDLAGGHLLILGHSLSDPHINELARRAGRIATESQGASTRVSFLMYERDEDRARLLEERGYTVCFGGVDEFFAALGAAAPEQLSLLSAPSADMLPGILAPATIDVAHAAAKPADPAAMFNGWPASHADVAAKMTFERTMVATMLNAFERNDVVVATIVGASGVGKTTAARQAMHQLSARAVHCWEHRSEQVLLAQEWRQFARRLHEEGRSGVLFVDDAHAHLQELNELLDLLILDGHGALRVICAAARNQWNPRVKSSAFFKRGNHYKLSKLNATEIDRLLNLVENNDQIRPLIEQAFSGFSRIERRRRLNERCEADMFVCLKNIFASDKFDDIILREYAMLQPNLQDIYRLIAAMEASGIRVHRQLVIRLLNIPSDAIASALTHLADIIHEYVVSEREGIYGWKGRHPVIVGIISRYKYGDVDKITKLFSDVIDNISPTYEIEIRTIREICNIESGLPRIPDKRVQNTLLRKMMSVAPGERVPRHRLIRNLISLGEYEQADTEIRIFEKDFNRDGPVARYKVTLLTARAVNSPGIMEEDRIAILRQASDLAAAAAHRFPGNKNVLAAYCEVGVELFKRTGSAEIFDVAIGHLKAAEARLGDPDVSRMIARYERSIAGEIMDASELSIADDS